MAGVLLTVAGTTEPVEVQLEPASAGESGAFVAHRGEQRIDIEAIRDGQGSGRLRIHGRVVPFHFVRRGDRIDVWVAGSIHRFELATRTARRAVAGPAATGTAESITAPMPGTIMRVQVSLGDDFVAHQPLVVMESMKMEMTLSAPHAGRVKEMLCRRGDMVDLGAILIRIGPPGGSDHVA